MSAYDDITHALEAAGCTQRGHDWTCPVHKSGGEKSPSLSVNEGDKGVVIRCQAGCETDQVLSAIGKKKNDLFDEQFKKTQQTSDVKRRVVATYDYKDLEGNLLYQVVRFEPKGFAQRVPDSTERSGWRWSIKGVTRTLFRLEQVAHAVATGVPVFVVEGEKDVEAIEGAGGTATCNSGGAGEWQKEYAEYFRGADVTVVGDKDDVGLKHARRICESLKGVARSVVLAQAAVGKDPHDHLSAGRTLDEFILIPDTLAEPVAEKINPLRARLLTIDEIDDIPPPTWLVEDFLVADSLAVIYGQPGHGKSFVALDWALSMCHDLPTWLGKKVTSGPVLYIVAEGLSGYSIRKRAWREMHPVHTRGDLTWLRDPVNLLDEEQVKHLIELCVDDQPLLVVVDTLARCMPGADENAPGPMSQAIEALDTIRRETKACVAAVHHAPKDGGTPRGHSSLLGAVQTSIEVAMLDGLITLQVAKQKDSAPTSMQLHLVQQSVSAALATHEGRNVSMSKSAVNTESLYNAIVRMSPHGGASASVLGEMTGIGRTMMFESLTALVDTDRVVRVGQKYLPYT